MKLRGSPASESLKARFDRKASALREDPSSGGCKARARVRSVYGLACEVEHDDRTIRVDLPASEGGNASGPHLGQLLRASLGACLLIGYRIWAARLDVPIDGVSLDVACEYDARGQLGVDPSVPVGWASVHFDVTIESDASEASVRRVVEVAHRHSPMLANLSPGVRRSLDVRVVPSTAGAREEGTREGTRRSA